MSATIPTVEPSSFTAGDTVKWRKTLSDYSASDSWVLTYYIRGDSAIDFSVTATADGAVHAVTISASQTAQLSGQNIRLIGKVSKAGEVFTVYDSRVDVSADPASQSVGTETRSFWRQTRDTLQNTYIKLVKYPEQSVSALGRSWTQRNLDELRRALDDAQTRVAQEEGAEALAQGKPSKKNILIQFNRPA